MIKLRLQALGEDGKEMEISSGEFLDKAVERALEGIPLDKPAHELFIVLVNGHGIAEDLWPVIKLKETDSVLIAPKIKGDNANGIFKSIIVLVVVAVVNFYAPGAGGVVLGLVAIGTSLLLNALIPPPVPEGLGGDGLDVASSQMYSISGQSNQVRRYGTVPRVYGTHRMFPAVAANPYTELEADPQSGELIQYLYAIYDFGFGPVKIEDIKIGDTPISTYSDVEYTIIDNKKPAVDEGEWDEGTFAAPRFYKGDVEAEQLAVALNGNRSAGDVLDEYQVIRNSASNSSGVDQSISLTFAAPRGLYGYASTGAISSRTIQLEVFFSKVGEDIWRPFNDLNYVKDFKAVGGDPNFQRSKVVLINPNLDPTNDGGYGGSYQLISVSTQIYQRDTLYLGYPPIYFKKQYVGLKAGVTHMFVKPNPVLIPGANIVYNGTVIGKVASIVPVSGLTDRINFTAPLTASVVIAEYEAQYQSGALFNPQLLRRVDVDMYYDLGSVGKTAITRADTNPIYATVKFTPKNPGQYKVRVERIATSSAYTSSVSDDLTLVNIVTRFDREPLLSEVRHTYFEVKIRATNQLNGAIANLSAQTTSILDVYDEDTQTWSKQPTRNPAWVFADLLTGTANKRAIDKSRLHLPSILEWAEYCDEVPDSPAALDYTMPRFECNFVLDYAVTLQGVLNQVGGAAQGSLNIIDGKYGVLIDRRRDVPVQIFTPRNSKNFSSNRVYTRKPHAITVDYINPYLEWNPAQVTVYDDGYDVNNATEFDEITSFACTNVEQAWRFGRFALAQNRLRQETISIEVDFEYMVCTRGDYVQVTQDIMRVGGTPARVKSITGNTIIIDDGIETNANPYGFVFRGIDGVIYQNTLTVVGPDEFELDGPNLPAPGDLIVIGNVDQIVLDCLVKSISPNDDMSATLILVEKADAVYDAESSDTFPPYDPKLSATTDPNQSPPGEVVDLVVADNLYECAGNGYRYSIVLDWDMPQGAAVEAFEIYVNSGKGYNFVATTRDTLYDYTVDQTRLGFEHTFKVLGVSATGRKLDLGAVGEVAATPMKKTASPSNVESLSIDITGEVLQLVWPQIQDCDVKEYLIRYSPNIGDTWESSIPLLRIDKNGTLASTQARTGAYFIKAVDFNDNESDSAVTAITTVPNLFGLNVIDEITDFPALPGAFDRTVKEGDTLVLQKSIDGAPADIEYYSEGFYYYNELLDLGEIYTVRLQSLIRAEGYTSEDVMANWPDLVSVLALANSRFSEWDVESQYRSTESFNVMSDWVTLDSIAALNEGNSEVFTEWRKFIMGDATGRVFQFRLRLISNKPSVTPRVFDGTIKADMPDRDEAFTNLIAPDTGLTVLYDPPFKGPGTTPNVQISMESGQSSDYWEFTSKSLDGFTIQFFDENDVPVERQFDAVVKGYGRKFTSVI